MIEPLQALSPQTPLAPRGHSRGRGPRAPGFFGAPENFQNPQSPPFFGQAAPRSGQGRPGPARLRQGPDPDGGQISPNFPKFPEIRQIRPNWPKNGQIWPKNGHFSFSWHGAGPGFFKIFGKNAISGHHLGVFEILARRGVSSVFRFMRIGPSPYRTNKRLSEFNSGL